MTDAEIAAARARAEAASPDWRMHHRHVNAGPTDDEMDGLGWDWTGPMPEPGRGVFARYADADFAQHARADVLALTQENDRLRGIIQGLLGRQVADRLLHDRRDAPEGDRRP